ncbi:DUF4974 domain-containing protein [Chitinophaga sp. SYP-B3965]|uniref:FecR family protein n=1 Tax=Chitinophaga sp. SYP-B3965 TaxID=2663120 RepID=UPI001299AA10|nr:FecR domain-containing protein [Chitinophaga sp. SYP-B3965]MRG44807.1 DUF4974 domain-containing protein [Chitinophaga sp. SYP-B3965]
MTNEQQKLKALLESSNWSDEDYEWLRSFLADNSSPELKAMLERRFEEHLAQGAVIEEELSQEMYGRIQKGIDTKVRTIGRNGRLWWTAAAVVGMLLGIGLLLRQRPTQTTFRQTGVGHKYIGGDKATLHLADGTVLALDSLQDGRIGEQVEKRNNSLSYLGARHMSWQILTTPNTGQYKITLADGSKVWLNSATELRFSTAFHSSTREVELKGEAYFEVAPSPGKPFIVKVNGMQIAVLGTQFNVMAYPDENQIKTVLVEGAVKLSTPKSAVVLKPGKQGSLTSGSDNFDVQDVDVEDAVSWKTGIYQFRNEGIEPIMRQVQRWYNVKVVYTGRLEKQMYTGTISRTDTLSDLLQLLEETGTIRFRIEKGTVYASQ